MPKKLAQSFLNIASNYMTLNNITEIARVSVAWLLKTKATTLLTLIFMEIYYGTNESKRPRPSCRTGCKNY